MIARHHTHIKTGLQFRETLRAGPYAWPGGYPLILCTSDGVALCFNCGRGIPSAYGEPEGDEE